MTPEGIVSSICEACDDLETGTEGDTLDRYARVVGEAPGRIRRLIELAVKEEREACLSRLIEVARSLKQQPPSEMLMGRVEGMEQAIRVLRH